MTDTLNTAPTRTLEEQFRGKSDEELARMREDGYTELLAVRTEEKMRAPIERHVTRIQAELDRRREART